MVTTRSRILTAMAVGSLFLASCGGDEPTSSGDLSDASDVSAALENLDETAALAGVPEECMAISMAMVAAMGTAGGAPTDAEVLTGVPNAFDAIRDQAPEDLRADIDTVKAGFVEYLAILERFDYDYTAMIADPGALEEMSGVMSSEEFTAANERFSTWLDELCNAQ